MVFYSHLGRFLITGYPLILRAALLELAGSDLDLKFFPNEGSAKNSLLIPKHSPMREMFNKGKLD